MNEFRVAIFISAVLLTASAGFGQRSVTRIRFARGATSAIVAGDLNGYRQTKIYFIRVRGRQTLSTSQVGTSHDITIYVTSPDGENVGDSDASCNNRREISPTESGDYKIKVVECQKADPWRGRFRFRIKVVG